MLAWLEWLWKCERGIGERRNRYDLIQVERDMGGVMGKRIKGRNIGGGDGELTPNLVDALVFLSMLDTEHLFGFDGARSRELGGVSEVDGVTRRSREWNWRQMC